MELSNSEYLGYFMQDIFWHVSGGPCGLQFCFKEGFDRGPKCGMSVRKTHNLSPRFLINRYQEPPMLNLHRLVMLDNTVVQDFNGHEVNGIHGLYGKKRYDKALYLVNKRQDITGIHDINGNFSYDDIFRKNHARL